MRYSHVLSLSAILIAGLALGSVNTASADSRGRDDGRRDNNSYRHDNDRGSRDRGRFDNNRNDSRRDYGRHDNHDNGKTTVIIKKDRDRWDVGDALLYHFGRTVINEVFQAPVRTTTVIVNGHYDYVWVEPIYEYRRTACGDLVKVVVREGFYKKVWVSATTSCETGYH